MKMLRDSDLVLCTMCNVSKAAGAAKKESRDLGKLLKRYRIDPESFRASG